MKNIFKISSIIFAALVICSCATVTEDYVEESINQEHYRNMPLFEDARVVKFYAKDRKVETVKGVCFISQDLNSFFDLPCRNVKLVITDFSGKSLESRQTDDEGRFQFSVKKGQRFLLTVDSSIYRTAAEKIHVRAGAELLIRLIKR